MQWVVRSLMSHFPAMASGLFIPSTEVLWTVSVSTRHGLISRDTTLTALNELRSLSNSNWKWPISNTLSAHRPVSRGASGCLLFRGAEANYTHFSRRSFDGGIDGGS